MSLSPNSKATADSVSQLAGANTKEVAEQGRGPNEVADECEERVLTAGLFPPLEDTCDQPQHDFGPRSAAQPTLAKAEASPGKERCETASTCASEDQDEDVFTRDETLFIFDYDDTLLPSTWLQRSNIGLDAGSIMSHTQREQLKQVEETAILLIRNAKQYGTVVLVTNAERGWIELSCQKFLPGLLPLLEDVKTISARTSFGSRYVSPTEWKLRAFEHELIMFYSKERLLCSCSRKNVLSLGDSVYERVALLQTTRDLPNCYPKTLKFVDRPDLCDLLKQHSLLNACFPKVVHHEGMLDLCIQCA